MTMKPLPLPVILIINDHVKMVVTHLDDEKSFLQLDVQCLHCGQVLYTRQIDVSQLAQAGGFGMEDATATKAHVEACERRLSH